MDSKNTSDKILALARKLKELAERGEGGEKISASQHLLKLLSKHGLTMADLEDDKKETQWFKVSLLQKRLFNQLIANVVGKDAAVWTSKRKRGQLGVDVTAAEHLELKAKYEHYWHAYQDELKIFFKAFVMKHGLYTNAPAKKYEDLTQDEIAEMERAEMIAAGLKDNTFKKRIANK